jgi:manganese transport protein
MAATLHPIRMLRGIGPGALVTAAFIGPGTVTVCTLAGADYGYTLIWALGFATIATIAFQEMSGRLGLVSQRGVGEALRSTLSDTIWRWPVFALVLVAIYGGNAAYEAGNLSGAALGGQAVLGESLPFNAIVLTIATVAALALWRGSYRQLERLLIGLVLSMAAAFVGTFVVSGAQWLALLEGLLVPRVPPGSLITVLALIGTTVVPYNLFLHAAAAKARWSGPEDLRTLRQDTVVSISLGGLVSMLIVSTAAAGLFTRGLSADNAADMALQLEPLFGPAAKYLLGTGLLAAGISSAITAPLATAYAVTEIISTRASDKDLVFRAVALSVLVIGSVFAMSGVQPIRIIVIAQFANGLLLPIIAGFLLYAMNDRGLLGAHSNGLLANTIGGIIFVIATGLGIRLLLLAS